MPDFGSPIINPSAPTAAQQGVQMLSGLLGIQKDQQALQIGSTEVQKAQQQQKERIAIQQMMSTGKDDRGNPVKDANGDPMLSTLLPALGRIAPLTGQAYAQSALKTAADHVALNAASAGLDMQHRKNLQGIIQGAATDPNATGASLTGGLDQYAEQHPDAAPTVKYLKNLVGGFDKIPQQQRPQEALKLSAYMQPGADVQTQPTPADVNTGASQQQGTRAAPIAGGGFTPATAVTNQLGPGIVSSTDAAGNTYMANQQHLGTSVAPGQGQDLPAAGDAPTSVAPVSDAELRQMNPSNVGLAQMMRDGAIQPAQLDAFNANRPAGRGQDITDLTGGQQRPAMAVRYPGPQPTEKDIANFGDYQTNLNQRVQIGTDAQAQIHVLESAIDGVRNKAGTSQRASMARTLQALNAPQSVVDAVAGGNLGKIQEAEKFLFQSTLTGLRQSMQGDSPAVAEFNQANKVFPDIDTDPRAKAKVLSFISDKADRDYAEQQALIKARKEGTFNPATWQGDYQKSLRAGAVPGTPESQVPKASGESAKAPNQAQLDYLHKHPESLPLFLQKFPHSGQ